MSDLKEEKVKSSEWAERIICLRNRKDLFESASEWFSSKWGVPIQAYYDSMQDSITASAGVPQWYVLLNDENELIAGMGVIENDFHKRPNLTPNICALFVEEPYRHQGIAKLLLDYACEELAQNGKNTAYLVTEHTRFYERCGWSFYDMIEENNGHLTRMYRHSM